MNSGPDPKGSVGKELEVRLSQVGSLLGKGSVEETLSLEASGCTIVIDTGSVCISVSVSDAVTIVGRRVSEYALLQHTDIEATKLYLQEASIYVIVDQDRHKKVGVARMSLGRPANVWLCHSHVFR